MALQLEDNTGKAWGLGITENNQALVQAEVQELQHYISINDAQVYQIIGEISDIASGINTLLNIRNDSSILKGIISYIRLQLPGVAGEGITKLPDEGTYFQFGKNSGRVSGGVEVVPENVNFSSGNVAELTAHKDMVITSDFVEIDRWYPDSSMQIFNKHGSVILGLNNNFELRLVTGDATLLTAYCRVTIMLTKNGGN